MDLQSVVQFVQAGIVGGGLITPAVVEALKSKYIPVQAQKYPRFTALVVSVVVSGYYVYKHNGDKIASGQWLPLAIVTLVMAAVTYNHVIK